MIDKKRICSRTEINANHVGSAHEDMLLEKEHLYIKVELHTFGILKSEMNKTSWFHYVD